MDKPISVGDLVVVVKPARCCVASLGTVFTVTRIRNNINFSDGKTMTVRCSWCGNKKDVPAAVRPVAEGFNANRGMPLVRLKRIPPLSELESERTEEMLKVPA